MSVEQRLEDVESRLAVLENGLSGVFDHVLKLGLSYTETQILALLLRREFVATEVLWEALWGNLCDRPQSANALRVHIHHLRCRLKPHGVLVTNRHGFGYSIHANHKQVIRELIANAAVVENAAVSDPVPDHSHRGGVVSCQGGEQWEPTTLGATRKKKSSGGTMMLD